MVRTIKLSAFISLKYVQIVRKTVRDLRNNNSKAIDIHHDQDGHNLVDSPCKYWANNNTNLRGLRAQSIVHTIKRLEEQIHHDVYVGKLIYVGNDHNGLLHDESTTKDYKY